MFQKSENRIMLTFASELPFVLKTVKAEITKLSANSFPHLLSKKKQQILSCALRSVTVRVWKTYYTQESRNNFN
jgi:hypothetical protein